MYIKSVSRTNANPQQPWEAAIALNDGGEHVIFSDSYETLLEDICRYVDTSFTAETQAPDSLVVPAEPLPLPASELADALPPTAKQAAPQTNSVSRHRRRT